jgi:outer membrane protein
MKSRIISFAMLFFSATAFAQETKMTLKQCIDSAIKNNILVKQSDLQSETANVNIKQAKANLLPNVNGNFSYGFNEGRSVDPITNSYINQQLTSATSSLSSNVVLYNGMRLQNLIKQNKLIYEANKMDLQQAKDNLALNVILAYLQVLSNNDVLLIAKAQSLVTKKQVERMDILVKEGAAANYLLSDLKGQLANEAISIVNATNALQQAILSLCQLMNVDYNAALQLENTIEEFSDVKYASSSAEVYKAALQNFSLVKANNLKIKSAAKAMAISRAGFYPTLSLNANLGSNYSSLAKTLSLANTTQEQTDAYVTVGGNQTFVFRQQQNYNATKTGFVKQLNNNLGTFVGLNVSIPLFNGFQTKNRVKAAAINLKTLQLESAGANLLLKQNIEQAYLNMTTSLEKYSILKEQVKDFEESFRAAEVRFANGVTNVAEYLISKNNLDRANINFTQTKYDYIFRIKLLNYFKGINE